MWNHMIVEINAKLNSFSHCYSLFSLIAQFSCMLGHNIDKPVAKEEMEPDVSGTPAELDPETL